MSVLEITLGNKDASTKIELGILIFFPTFLHIMLKKINTWCDYICSYSFFLPTIILLKNCSHKITNQQARFQFHIKYSQFIG